VRRVLTLEQPEGDRVSVGAERAGRAGLDVHRRDVTNVPGASAAGS
jgi:hypothetical protein